MQLIEKYLSSAHYLSITLQNKKRESPADETLPSAHHPPLSFFGDVLDTLLWLCYSSR
jgi:hypothetical protein